MNNKTSASQSAPEPNTAALTQQCYQKMIFCQLLLAQISHMDLMWNKPHITVKYMATINPFKGEEYWHAEAYRHSNSEASTCFNKSELASTAAAEYPHAASLLCSRPSSLETFLPHTAATNTQTGNKFKINSLTFKYNLSNFVFMQ